MKKSLTKAFIILKQYCESQKGVLEKVTIKRKKITCILETRKGNNIPHLFFYKFEKLYI